MPGMADGLKERLWIMVKYWEVFKMMNAKLIV